MENYKTEQEKFWAGSFGDEYIDRNKDAKLLASNIHYFSKILEKTKEVETIIEFGANIGMNVLALKNILPACEISAIEINEKAIEQLQEKVNGKVYHQSILEFSTDYKRDLVFTKGVLIHINPGALNDVYEKLYASSEKYICIGEYYNPTPFELNYRGHNGFLYKRDFAGELLKKYNDLKLVDYGFFYHLDNNFPQDDISWFLLEKVGS